MPDPVFIIADGVVIKKVYIYVDAKIYRPHYRVQARNAATALRTINTNGYYVANRLY